jgi:hypothetical protein
MRGISEEQFWGRDGLDDYLHIHCS